MPKPIEFDRVNSAMKFIVLTFLAIFLPTTTTSPASEPSPPSAEKAAAVSTNETSYIQQLKDLIDSLTSQSKEAGEKGKTITKETGHWIKEDFKKIGDWEYKQIKLELSELTTLEKTPERSWRGSMELLLGSAAWTDTTPALQASRHQLPAQTFADRLHTNALDRGRQLHRIAANNRAALAHLMAAVKYRPCESY